MDQANALAILTTLVLTTLFTSNAHAQSAPTNVREVPVILEDVYLPDAPVAGREAKITVEGTLRSGCYRKVRAEVDSPNARTHYVRAVALKLVQGACTQSVKPYVEEVSLGTLAAGDHDLIVKAAGGPESFVVHRFRVAPTEHAPRE